VKTRKKRVFVLGKKFDGKKLTESDIRAIRKIEAASGGGRELSKAEVADFVSRPPPLSYEPEQWIPIKRPIPLKTGKRGRPQKNDPPSSPAEDKIARRDPLIARYVTKPANARKQWKAARIKIGDRTRDLVADHDAQITTKGRTPYKSESAATVLGVSARTVRRSRNPRKKPAP
jgi:hypothetical protein